MSDPNTQTAAQNQTSPQPGAPQTNETVVLAPSEFKKDFVGMMDDKHAIRMSLERKSDNLTGAYFYERVAASNGMERTLKLKGRIDGDGNVTLAETSGKTGNPQKTGEFIGTSRRWGCGSPSTLMMSAHTPTANMWSLSLTHS
jgi:hypothetical protein